MPLFVSHRTLAGRRTLPVAAGRWALDSGAFSELAIGGAFATSATDYAAAIRRYHDTIGGLDWAAPQDWMCEPWMLAKTGLTVPEHQARTVASVLTLRAAALPVPVIPVLQGWTRADYLRHVEDYDRAGLPLDREPLVGLGSVCRRQATAATVAIVAQDLIGLRLHGFGVKLNGLARMADVLTSADSMAWSLAARWGAGCGNHAGKCNNCLSFALQWRARVVSKMGFWSLLDEVAHD